VDYYSWKYDNKTFLKIFRLILTKEDKYCIRSCQSTLQSLKCKALNVPCPVSVKQKNRFSTAISLDIKVAQDEEINKFINGDVIVDWNYVKLLSTLGLFENKFIPLKSVDSDENIRLLSFFARNELSLGLTIDSYSAIFRLSPQQEILLLHQLSDADTVVEATRILIDMNISKRILPKVVVEDHVQKALMAEYDDTFANKSRFLKHLESALQAHQKLGSVYMAPYFTVTQASGTGKTKLFVEVAQDVPSIYISLAPSESSAYPRRTQKFASELTNLGCTASNINEAVKSMKVVILSMVCLGIQTFSHFCPNMWLGKRISNKMRRKACKSFFESQDVAHAGDNSKLTIKDFEGLQQKGYEYLMKLLNDLLPALPNAYFLLIIDEARGLLDANEFTPFRVFQRALREIDSALTCTAKIFAVLADTYSRIANFTPPDNLDWSRRTTEANLTLHAPFILVNNFDIFAHTYKIVDRQSLVSLKRVYHYSRPLWKSYIDSLTLNEVSRFARIKLLGGKDDTAEVVGALGEEQRLAVLSMRIPLGFASFGRFSEKLPASHMRLITGISSCRQLVFSEAPAEPILAYAAASLMMDADPLGLNRFHPGALLHELRKFMSAGFVDTATVGEQITALLYILARDQVLERQQRKQPNPIEIPLVTIKDLLDAIRHGSVGVLRDRSKKKKKIVNKLSLSRKRTIQDISGDSKVNPISATGFNQECRLADEDAQRGECGVGNSMDEQQYRNSIHLEELLQCHTSFVQFIEISYTPTVEDLWLGFKRCVAFIARRGQAGVDIFIPAWLDRPFTLFPGVKLVEYLNNFRNGHLYGSWQDSSKLFDNIDEDDSMWLKYKKSRFDLTSTERDWIKNNLTMILIQVKTKSDSSNSNLKRDCSGINPGFSGVIRDWDTDFQKPYLAIIHYLLAESNVSKMPLAKPSTIIESKCHDQDLSPNCELCHGIVFKGLSDLTCLTNLTTEKWDMVDLVLKLIQIYPNNFQDLPKEDKIPSASMCPLKHKLSASVHNNNSK